MYAVSPSLSRYDVIEQASMGAVGLKVVGDGNRGSKSSGEPLRRVIEDYYLTDVITRRLFPLVFFVDGVVLRRWRGVVRHLRRGIRRFNRNLKYHGFLTVLIVRLRTGRLSRREKMHWSV